MPFLNASVLRGLNIDLQELYSFYDTVRGYGPDVVSSMARTVIDLQSHGTDPAGMVKKLESLGSEIRDLENRKDQLAQDVSSAEEAMKEKIGAKESLEKEISEMRSILSSLKQQKRDITNEIKKNSHRIAKSDRFWSAADAMGIDAARVAEFMENARSMGYVAKTIPSIKEIEKIGMDRSMSSDEMRTLILSIRQLESEGWSPESIVKLSIAMDGVADNPDAVIDHMREYSHKYRDVEKAMDDLEKQVAKARSDHDRRKRALGAEIVSLHGEMGELKKSRDSLMAEASQLNEKKQEIEANYRRIEDEFRKYGLSAVTIAELQDAIDIKEQEKKELENSIGHLRERLSALRIGADVAEALPSIITGKDMKLRDLCAAFISGRNVSDADADKIRERIINGLIEISAGGIVPVHYSSYDHFIFGYRYDRLMQLERDRAIAAEEAELNRIQDLYGKDVRSYLEDYLDVRIPDYSLGYTMIRDIAENVFRKEVNGRRIFGRGQEK
jgi:chromosome segregation ATPase